MAVVQRQEPWDFIDSESWGEHRLMVFANNLKGFPTGDNGAIRILIANHPHHAATWDAIEEHGVNREVGVFFGEIEYYYMCVFGENEDAYYLVPIDGRNDELPDNRKFLESCFHLRMPW